MCCTTGVLRTSEFGSQPFAEAGGCGRFWQGLKNGMATRNLVINCHGSSLFRGRWEGKMPSHRHCSFWLEDGGMARARMRNVRSCLSVNMCQSPSFRKPLAFQNHESLDYGASTSGVDMFVFYQAQRMKRRSLKCNAESGNSGDLGDSTGQLGSSEKAQFSSSKLQDLLLYLKQVDWTKFVFRWERNEPLWNVPWNGQVIFQVMVLWFAAFWVMGSWIIPISAQLAGFNRHTLSFRGQALYSLVTDIAEGTVGIWILRKCLTRFLPLPEGWFPINFKGRWFLEATWGCLLFPLVNKLSQLNLVLLPLPTPLQSSYVEQSMMSRDPIATILYAVVISLCAPVWEEVIFRGFLLPSMTRYLPLWGAIFVSALAFALAHFSMQRILPLTFLGLVMGFVFVRSRNLLASIVLHSLWNGFAFLELL